ncbi:MAG: hypothetical protein EOS36_05025 [Mesorhizobium sp.]|nr:MAG: hypothetical protein EOS36_05025 [Mesorhizobium sp.]RWE51222.1 MAG: hypothetical protein EOS79_01970 [Mesorhizobium sp.]
MISSLQPRARLRSYGAAGYNCRSAGRLALRVDPAPAAAGPRKAAALGPSRHIVFKLAALFSLDAFAEGFVVQSLPAPTGWPRASPWCSAGRRKARC